jgi:hypothetical protein
MRSRGRCAAARRLAPREALHLDLGTLGRQLSRCLALGCILLELGQLEFELFEHHAALR